MENYTPYGKEWEAEMNKLPKSELIKMILKLQTGTQDKKLMLIETAKQANRQVEGIINDYECGIIDKLETIRLFGEYTGRIMEIFWKNAKLKAKEEIEFAEVERPKDKPSCPSCKKQLSPAGGTLDGKEMSWACWDCCYRQDDIHSHCY